MTIPWRTLLDALVGWLKRKGWVSPNASHAPTSLPPQDSRTDVGGTVGGSPED